LMFAIRINSSRRNVIDLAAVIMSIINDFLFRCLTALGEKENSDLKIEFERKLLWWLGSFSWEYSVEEFELLIQEIYI
jgi:hypothetical protein